MLPFKRPVSKESTLCKREFTITISVVSNKILKVNNESTVYVNSKIYEIILIKERGKEKRREREENFRIETKVQCFKILL